MLTSAIIILREFLEASLLISLLATLHLKFRFYRNWIVAVIVCSIFTAFLYSTALNKVSVWFDGSGQEVINAIALLLIAFLLVLHNTYINLIYRKYTNLPTVQMSLFFPLTVSAIILIVVAITREGSEAFVYYLGLHAHPERSTSMLIGGIIGSGLGICISILVFVSLYQLSNKNIIFITSVLFMLITAGIMSEVIQSLIQAGWVMPGVALWDSSSWIPESSIVGQLLYAVFFYEATPTPEEVAAWVITLLCQGVLLIGIHYSYLIKNRATPHDK